MYRFAAISAVVTLTVVLSSTASASIITVVDQQNLSGGGLVALGGNSSLGQSFKPTLSRIDAVELWLSNGVNTGSHARLDIYQGVGFTNLLGSSGITVVPGGAALSQVHFDLSPSISLTPQTPYSFSVVNLSGFVTLQVAITLDAYAGGTHLNSNGNPVLSRDLRFVEGVHSPISVAPVPEPSTLVMWSLLSALTFIGVRCGQPLTWSRLRRKRSVRMTK